MPQPAQAHSSILHRHIVAPTARYILGQYFTLQVRNGPQWVYVRDMGPEAPQPSLATGKLRRLHCGRTELDDAQENLGSKVTRFSCVYTDVHENGYYGNAHEPHLNRDGSCGRRQLHRSRPTQAKHLWRIRCLLFQSLTIRTYCRATSGDYDEQAYLSVAASSFAC